MNRDSFFKFQNESRIDNSRKFENCVYPTLCNVATLATKRQQTLQTPRDCITAFAFKYVVSDQNLEIKY